MMARALALAQEIAAAQPDTAPVLYEALSRPFAVGALEEPRRGALLKVASLGVQVHGGMGYIEETGAAQHYRDARIAAIMTIVGAIDIPIIKYSVDWWNTLHQPASVFRIDGPAISGSMLWPLIVMGVALIPAGIWAFGRAERYAKRTGKLKRVG